MIILIYELRTLNIRRLHQQSIKWYPNRINLICKYIWYLYCRNV